MNTTLERKSKAEVVETPAPIYLCRATLLKKLNEYQASVVRTGRFDSQPQQWWTIDYIGGTLHIGYTVTFQMNSKNSYGGYIGFRKWLVLLRDNQIVSVTYDVNPWSQEFYTGSVSKGFKYGNYNSDQARDIELRADL